MQASKMAANNSSNENVFSWLELESDPGLFTLLVDDFGVKGVQVEEIYDLSKNLEESIFGFIFLFKWMERKAGRRSKSSALDPNSTYSTDPDIVNRMFFAHQIVPNSCATHALLSILLNCKSRKDFHLGDLLAKFQKNCEGLSPENKGYAIGNQPKLAQAHNSYAKPDNQSNRINHINDSPYATSSSIASSSMPSFSSAYNQYQTSASSLSCSSNSYGKLTSTTEGVSTQPGAELFHFICFVPIEGRLYELDGLKPFPIDHGPVSTEAMPIVNDAGNWTNKFKNIIKQRLSSFNSGQQNHEIRFNLMALVPDRMSQLIEQTDLIKHNYTKVEALLNEFRSDSGCQQQLNENDLNANGIKSEVNVKQESFIKRENEDELAGDSSMPLSASLANSDIKPVIRQLRSTRSTTQMTNNPKDNETSAHQNSSRTNEQFEIRFVGSDDAVDDNKFEINELCKKYRIESINQVPSSAAQRQLKLNLLMQSQSDLMTDLKEKENEIISKIKSQINSNGLVNGDVRSECELENGEVFSRRLFIDSAGLKLLESKLNSDLHSAESELNEESEKRKKYRTDALRRKHIYDEFIVTYLKILSEDGKLAELIRNNSNTCFNNSNQKNGSMLQSSSNKRKKKLSN